MFIRDAFAQTVTWLPSISGAPEPKSPAALVAYIFLASLALGGLAAFTAFLIGALRYFFAAGSASAVADGKDRMVHALAGLFVLVLSVVFLYAVNPSLLRLRNPGLPTPVIPTLPQAGGCDLITAQWAGGFAVGNQVGLVATTSGCKEGDLVTFTVFKNGTGVLATLSGPITNGQASAFWTVPTLDSAANLTFRAAIGGRSLLAGGISMGGGGTLPPTFEGCQNPAKGQAAPSTCSAPCETTVTEALYGPGNGCTDIIKNAAREFGVPASLIVSVMQHECNSGSPNCQYAGNADGTRDCGLLQVNETIVNDSECRTYLGTGVSTGAQACDILKANPTIAVRVGACKLRQAQRSAESVRSAYGYAASITELVGAAYAGGSGANGPSCNCRPDGGDVPSGCSASSHICLNCSANIPRWMCPYDYATSQPAGCTRSLPLNQCFLNDDNPCKSLKTAKDMAASMVTFSAHFASCPQWR